MTLAEWQTSPELIAAWAKLINSELFKTAWSVLDEMGPVHYSPHHNADHATRNASVLLGQVQCHVQTIRNIRTLASPPPDPTKQPVATYGAKPESV